MEWDDVPKAQTAMAEAVPTRRDDRRGEPKVIDITNDRIAAVVRGIQEVSDPAGGIRRSDRRTGHPRETELGRSGCAAEECARPERGSDH
jgi:hypothetical protein